MLQLPHREAAWLSHYRRHSHHQFISGLRSSPNFGITCTAVRILAPPTIVLFQTQWIAQPARKVDPLAGNIPATMQSTDPPLLYSARAATRCHLFIGQLLPGCVVRIDWVHKWRWRTLASLAAEPGCRVDEAGMRPGRYGFSNEYFWMHAPAQFEHAY